MFTATPKKLYRVLLVLLISSFPFMLHADPTETIKYYTENFPPFNMEDENNMATGMNTEIILEMLKEMNSSKNINDLQVIPWARGYKYAQDHDANAALYSTVRTEARENLFKWVGPMSIASNGLVVLKGNPKNVNQPEPFKYRHDLKYGTIRNDLGEQLLTESGVPDSQIQKVARFEQLIKLLTSGRIDCISYMVNVAMWQIRSLGYDTSKFEVASSDKIGEHFIAFSKGVSDDIINAHQKALDRVMQNTALVNQIRSKYR